MTRSLPTEPDRARERVARAIARAGLCSRRDAERLILDGRVAVNGRRIDSPALDVTPADRVTVDGRPLPAREPVRLFLYHKPRGLITTNHDPEGRETVFDRLPADLPRVVSVGRLDYNSEGLLLLTNDGELARRLESPATAWRRRYRVRVYGTPDADAVGRLAQGMTVEGVRYGPIEVEIEHEGTNAWLSVVLTEGKNREIRRVLESLGHPVSRLIRVAYGPFQIGRMHPGEVREVTARMLKDQLGPRPGVTPRSGARPPRPARLHQK
jgi:23S rRNA pseudouridine2605 synthase